MRPRIAAGVVALTLAGVATVLVVRGFLPNSISRPGPAGNLPGSSAAANGRVAFVRTDPTTATAEGATVEAAIYSVEADGTGLARLAGGAIHRSAPAWSPDGSKIAFSRGGIVVLRADGSALVPVTECVPPECEGDGAPTWAPDGSRIAFPSLRNGGAGLWVTRADGGLPVPIRDGLSILGSPSWSPDGSHIAVVAPVGDRGQGAIVLVRVADGAIARTISAEGLEFIESVSWSADGERLAAYAMSGDGSKGGEGVYVMGVDGSDLRRLSTCPSASCADLSPAWSPDGTQIVFTRALPEPGSDGFVGDLLVFEVETGRVRALTAGPGLDCCPSWQPRTQT